MATPDKISEELGTLEVAVRPNTGRQVEPGGESSPIPLEDAKLIEQVRAGQTEAYGELVRKYQDRVFNTCWRICGHLEDARDLTQEAFLRAFDHLEEFRQQSGFYTWLFRVAVNLSLTYRRNVKRRRVVSYDQLADATGTQAEGLAARVAGKPSCGRRAADEPSKSASDAELQRCVARALQELDDDHRAVVVLRDMEGFDYRQIAEILSIPPGTVRSRLHRARETLRGAIHWDVGHEQ